MRREDKALQDKALQDKTLQYKTLQDKALQNKVLQDKVLQDKVLHDKAQQSKACVSAYQQLINKQSHEGDKWSEIDTLAISMMLVMYDESN